MLIGVMDFRLAVCVIFDLLAPNVFLLCCLVEIQGPLEILESQLLGKFCILGLRKIMQFGPSEALVESFEFEIFIVHDIR